MNSKLNRREFLKLTGAVSLGAMALGMNGASAETKPSTRSMKLPQRILGKTGESVSILGLGGVGMIVESEEDEAVAMLNEAIDRGITYFDTAPNYGANRLSEHRLGLVMAKRRKEVFLATKIEHRDYDGAMKDIEESLKELQTDQVDLAQLHLWPNRQSADMEPFQQIGKPDGVIRAMQKMKEQGVIRFMGLTGHPYTEFNTRDDMRRAVAYYDFDTVLCFINPTNQSLWNNRELIPIAKRKNMGIIGMKAFGGGQPGYLVGKKAGQCNAPELLRYAFSQPIHVTIPAVSSIDHLHANIQAAKAFKPMSAAEQRAIIAKVNAVRR
jgi:aryl-alcohol dehydrogenase-like predicted oxidoreductase